MVKITVSAALLWGAVLASPLTAAHHKLFVLTGQSNSLGVTNGGEADPSIGSDPADAAVKFFWHNRVDATTSLGDSGGVFTTLQEQQGGYYAGSATHWGPEIEFARNLYRAGVRDFGVIKASRGGGGNTLWHKASGGHMYQHVVDTVNAATATLTANGDTFEVVGLLYLQGESDDAAEAAVAGSRFKELVDNLRVDLNGATNLHAVIGGIAAATANDDTVRTNQATIADSTASIDYFDNLDLQSQLHDGLHFNKAAKFTLGGRYAQAFLDAGIVSRHYGKLVFVGDSITQGGNGYPGYRYRVFENLANQGVPAVAATGYEFVGSVTGAYQTNAGPTPDVNGQSFVNQHDGHWGWRASWESGRVALPGGRYDVNNLGSGTLENWTGQAATFDTADAGTLSYTGTTYVPDTVVMKIGINDLSDGTSATQVRDDIGTMIDQLRAANPNVRIHLCQVLYSNNVAFAPVDAVNALLPALVTAKNAASSTSPVWLVEVNEGFDPSTMTYDNTHPNAAGEDFVGDRVSEGLGIIGSAVTVETPLPLEEKVGEDLGVSVVEGDDIWNSGSYANGWTAGGGILPSAVGDDDLRMNHPGGTADVLDGTAAGWTAFNTGPWVFEARLKFEANPNGFILWLGTGTKRILIEIHGDRTQDFGANAFNVAHDNLDGEFHTWRVEHDPAAAVYHVWRDDVLLTPGGGAPYDQTGTDARLLLGDYTSSGFGNGFDVTLDRLNMGPLFGGGRMYDGSAWVNGWAQVGGISPSLVAEGVQVVNTTGGGSWVEGTHAGWSDGNDGPWTLEARMKFNANPNGFILWLGTGNQRIYVEIHGNRTQDTGGESFNVAHDNLDGAFHTWRVGHDPEAGVYHVWRDGERLTPVDGAPYDAGPDGRMILGDYTSGSFGNGFDVVIDAVRFDFGNAYLPPGADADGDGMSDLWEEEKFGGIVAGDATVDDDGDGKLNGEEYEADTDPLDATSRFSASIDGDGLVSVADSSLRRIYTLWFSSDLGMLDPWSEVVDAIDRVGNGGELALGGGFQTETSGFYQVQVAVP